MGVPGANVPSIPSMAVPAAIAQDDDGRYHPPDGRHPEPVGWARAHPPGGGPLGASGVRALAAAHEPDVPEAERPAPLGGARFVLGLLAGAGLALGGLAAWRARHEEDPLAALKAGDALVVASVTDGVRVRAGMREERKDGPYPWRIVINPQGFREDAPTPARPAVGVRRLVVLGDSWAFGYGVDQGKTLSEQLEELLPAELGVDVDVVNAGVFGAGAFDVLRRYHRLDDEYAFDGVVLVVPRNGNRASETAKERALWYASSGERLPPFFLPFEARIRALRAPPEVRRPVLRGDPSYQDLGTLVADVRADGRPIWLVQTPSRAPGSPHPMAESPGRELAAALGVPLARHALDERNCWGFADEAHASEAGVRALASVVAEAIATDRSVDRATPRCGDVPGVGPNKDGWPPPWRGR